MEENLKISHKALTLRQNSTETPKNLPKTLKVKTYPVKSETSNIDLRLLVKIIQVWPA